MRGWRVRKGFVSGSGIGLVDDKGRVAIPNALRSTLAQNAPRPDGKDGGTIIIAVHETERCLIAYDPGYVAVLKKELDARTEMSRGPDGRIDYNIKRDLANGEAVPFDGSGRFIMPGFPVSMPGSPATPFLGHVRLYRNLGPQDAGRDAGPARQDDLGRALPLPGKGIAL